MTAATTPFTTSAPVAERKRFAGGRILAVDATRGLALVGMMAVHSLESSTPGDTPTFAFDLFAGRAAAAYAVLAGLSIALITGRRRLEPGPEAAGKIASLVARGLIIGAIGLFLAYFSEAIYAAVILPYYAVMFVVAAPLTLLRTRTLMILAPVLVIGTPILSQWVRPMLPDPIVHQLGFADLATPGDLLSTLLFTGEFPAVVWMTYVVVGIVLGRLDLRSVGVAYGLLATGLTMMVVAPVLSTIGLKVLGGEEIVATDDYAREVLKYGADGVVPTDTWWWLTVDGPHTGTQLDLIATIGSTLAVLAVFLLLRELTSGIAGRLVRLVMLPLVAAGAVSLTAYVGHILFINSDFDVYGPEGGYVRQLVFIGVAAILWRMTAGRGPLEGLVASCTRRVDRWTRQKLRTRPSTPGCQ